MVVTHLDPNTEVHQKTPRGYGANIGVGGNTPSHHSYVTPLQYGRNGPNNRMIVIFGPMSSTVIKADKAQP